MKRKEQTECICDMERREKCPIHGHGTHDWAIEQFEAWWFAHGKEARTTNYYLTRLAWLAATKAMKAGNFKD